MFADQSLADEIQAKAFSFSEVVASSCEHLHRLVYHFTRYLAIQKGHDRGLLLIVFDISCETTLQKGLYEVHLRLLLTCDRYSRCQMHQSLSVVVLVLCKR